jgi:hypothetical protein
MHVACADATPDNSAMVLLVLSPCHNNTPISANIAGPTTTRNDGRYEARFTTEPALTPMTMTVMAIRLIGCWGSRNSSDAKAQMAPMRVDPSAELRAHDAIWSAGIARRLKTRIWTNRTTTTSPTSASHASR